MGKASRQKPKYLGEKLKRIRLALEQSQGGMLRLLGIEEEGYRNYISDFENDKREPALPVLLRYAQVANVWVDVLINDEVDLPKRIPSARRHEGIKRILPNRRRKD
jgi:transcriptional regulator with XRE-family HTH domain